MPIFVLSEDLVFPPAHLATPEGLLAMGGDLEPDRILLAYKNGIFPWYSQGEPILWWSPNPRMILLPDSFNSTKSLNKKITSKRFQVSLDRCFMQVINLCARVRTENGQGTWITAEMIAAYGQLHHLGYAHSVEIWYREELAGGLYGLSLGRCFFGESMFSIERDASKVALYHLCHYLKSKHFEIIDCQVPSDHLKRLGAVCISRKTFLNKLQRALQYPSLVGPWTL